MKRIAKREDVYEHLRRVCIDTERRTDASNDAVEVTQHYQSMRRAYLGRDGTRYGHLLLIGGELLAERCRTDDLMSSISLLCLPPCRVNPEIL